MSGVLYVIHNFLIMKRAKVILPVLLLIVKRTKVTKVTLTVMFRIVKRTKVTLQVMFRIVERTESSVMQYFQGRRQHVIVKKADIGYERRNREKMCHL